MSLVPVSYTHLDVYKRQDIGIQKRADQESGQTGYSDAGRNAENEVEALLSFPKRSCGHQNGKLPQKMCIRDSK